MEPVVIFSIKFDQTVKDDLRVYAEKTTDICSWK